MLAHIRAETLSKRREGLRYTGLLKEMAETTFKELVQQGGARTVNLSASGESTASSSGGSKSMFMKYLFESSVLVAGLQAAGDKTGTIKRRAEDIWRICPTIFTASDTTTFVGESILQQALREKDGVK